MASDPAVYPHVQLTFSLLSHRAESPFEQEDVEDLLPCAGEEAPRHVEGVERLMEPRDVGRERFPEGSLLNIFKDARPIAF